MEQPDQPGHDLPFSEQDWTSISEALAAHVNAVFADEWVRARSAYQRLSEVIDGLRDTYDNHPTLNETLADATDDPAERCRLYALAANRARVIGFPTYTILYSWAETLAHAGDAETARRLLEECGDEMARWGDAGERAEYAELLRNCGGEPPANA